METDIHCTISNVCISSTPNFKLIDPWESNCASNYTFLCHMKTLQNLQYRVTVLQKHILGFKYQLNKSCFTLVFTRYLT